MRKRLHLLWPALLFSLMLMPFYMGAQITPETITGRLYVKAGASGDGSSWENAHPSLADVMEYARKNSNSVSEIWVTAGEYKPKNISYAAATTFILPGGTKIYGGFAGDERSPGERKWGDDGKPVYKSILSGEGVTECYHVVLAYGSAECYLDGFSITGGKAFWGGNMV